MGRTSPLWDVSSRWGNSNCGDIWCGLGEVCEMAMERFMTKPVAYINVEERKLEWATPIKWETPTVINLPFNIPLYIAPPQREWVGLTEKETIDLALNAFALPEVSLKQRLRLHQELVIAMNEPDSRLMIFAATIEQALKEKNGG